MGTYPSHQQGRHTATEEHHEQGTAHRGRDAVTLAPFLPITRQPWLEATEDTTRSSSTLRSSHGATCARTSTRHSSSPHGQRHSASSGDLQFPSLYYGIVGQDMKWDWQGKKRNESLSLKPPTSSE